MSFAKGFTKIAKVVSGVQAYQDRKEANAIKASSEELYNHWKKEYEVVEKSAKDSISCFGEVRLNSLKNTVGGFLKCLKDMGQKNKDKSYEMLDEIEIPREVLNELGSLEMSASAILGGTVTTGVLGTAAALGVMQATPLAVTGAVGALASASTGTAISSLSGAAASNAILAWLGGGSIASGGGVIAAGAATLATITTAATAVATGGVAIATAGIIASRHFSKKLTEAKEYEKAVSIEVEKLKNGITLWQSLQQRADELKEVTLEVESKAIRALDLLEPLVPDFESDLDFYKRSFQQCGLFIKALGELAKAPLTDAQGNMTLESEQIIQKTHTLLNSELERS